MRQPAHSSSCLCICALAPLPDAEALNLTLTLTLTRTRCDSLASKYDFGMSLTAAWKVHSPPCEAAWEGQQQQRQAAHKASKVTRLFHGTVKDAARAPRALQLQHPRACRPLPVSRPCHPHASDTRHPRRFLPGAILADGFRLPAHAGMFGRGIYFADTPLKSLQYTGGKLEGCMGKGRRYMLVCDVELGNQLETTSAKSSLEPETDLRRGGMPALLGQKSFDSVAAKPSLFGLRAPEFVVYKPAQVRPRYLLAVEQVPKDSADALGSVAEKRAHKARARFRAAAAAAAVKARDEAAAEAKVEAEAEAEAAAAAAAPPPA